MCIAMKAVFWFLGLLRILLNTEWGASNAEELQNEVLSSSALKKIFSFN